MSDWPASAPVGSDEENSLEADHTAKSRSRSKPGTPGKDPEEDCFVVDAEGRRVEATGTNFPVTLPQTPPSKKRAAEGESGFLFSAIKNPSTANRRAPRLEERRDFDLKSAAT